MVKDGSQNNNSNDDKQHEQMEDDERMMESSGDDSDGETYYSFVTHGWDTQYGRAVQNQRVAVKNADNTNNGRKRRAQEIIVWICNFCENETFTDRDEFVDHLFLVHTDKIARHGDLGDLEDVSAELEQDDQIKDQEDNSYVELHSPDCPKLMKLLTSKDDESDESEPAVPLYKAKFRITGTITRAEYEDYLRAEKKKEQSHAEMRENGASQSSGTSGTSCKHVEAQGKHPRNAFPSKASLAQQDFVGAKRGVCQQTNYQPGNSAKNQDKSGGAPPYFAIKKESQGTGKAANLTSIESNPAYNSMLQRPFPMNPSTCEQLNQVTTQSRIPPKANVQTVQNANPIVELNDFMSHRISKFLSDLICRFVKCAHPDFNGYFKGEAPPPNVDFAMNLLLGMFMCQMQADAMHVRFNYLCFMAAQFKFQNQRKSDKK